MSTQTSVQIMPDGTRVDRYKNLVRNIAHRPVLLMQWGRWACVSHNARGEGSTITNAYGEWARQMRVNKERERRMDQRRNLNRPPGL